MRRKTIIAWVRFNGLIVLAIAIVGLAGHLAGEEHLYNWNGSRSAGMGVNTAVEFIAVGISLILLSMLEHV